jgi:hypothetical protein
MDALRRFGSVFSMDAEAFVQAMLKTDPSIRFVAVVSDDYRILASKQREGVAPLTSDEVQRNFVSIVPQIIIESIDKLAPFLGKVGGATVHYGKALLVLYRFESLIVLVTFEPEVATPFYNRITEEFKKHSAQYLT